MSKLFRCSMIAVALALASGAAHAQDPAPQTAAPPQAVSAPTGISGQEAAIEALVTARVLAIESHRHPPLTAEVQQVPLQLTGVPQVDRLIVIFTLIAGIVGALASVLAHFVDPDTGFGKVVSWLALNFGKKLKATAPAPDIISKGRGIGAAALFLCFGLGLTACKAGWLAAEASVASCYGITQAERDQARSDIVNALAKVFPSGNYLGALQSLGAAYANDPPLKCGVDTVIAEIEHPNGGEAPYVPPDGGTAKPAVTFAHVSTSLGTEAKQVPIESLAALQTFRDQLAAKTPLPAH